MSEVTFGIVVILAGVVCVAAFAYLNMVLQPKRFPYGVAASSPGQRSDQTSSRSAFVLLGIIEAVVFFLGVALMTAGSAVIGTSIGYT